MTIAEEAPLLGGSKLIISPKLGISPLSSLMIKIQQILLKAEHNSWVGKEIAPKHTLSLVLPSSLSWFYYLHSHWKYKY